MERHSDTELRQLTDLISRMGMLVEEAIDTAIRGLTERQAALFESVYSIENDINQLHIAIDEACVRLIAKHSPVASNLRLVVAAIKVNTDLERMGDQAVNIAHNSHRYIESEPLKPLVDIPHMTLEVKAMVRESLESFFQGDVSMARKVLERDDIVDNLKNEVFRELITYMGKDPGSIERAMNLILIARNLERLGDHATNIAEDAIYLVTGEDIRHGARKSKAPGRPE